MRRCEGPGSGRPAAPSAGAAGGSLTFRRAPASGPDEPDWPDFSPDFIREAAGWGVRERESYLAQLRRRGVHRSSIEGWLAAVDEYRALEAGEADDAPDPEIDPEEDDEGGAGGAGSGGAPPVLYH